MAKFDWSAYPTDKPAAKEGGKKFDWNSYEVERKAPRTSAAQTALESYGNSATLGYLPNLQALAGKLIPNPNAELDEKLKAEGFDVKGAPEQTYIKARDENIARQKLQASQNPVASGVGTAAGIVASAVGTGGLGAVAKGASGVKRLAAATKAGAVLGGLANPGDVKGDVALLQLDDRIKNAAVGAGLGMGGQILAEGAGAVAAPVSKYLSDKAAKSATRSLGRPTPTQAAKMAKSGDDIAIGRGLLDEGAIPVFGTSGRVAKRVEKLRDKSWNEVESLLKSGGDEATVDGAEAAKRILDSEDLALLREAGETQSVKALEDAAEQLAGMGKVSLEKAQRIKKTIDDKINYNAKDPTSAASQEGRFAKRTALRDQMDRAVTDLGAGEGALKAAFKKQGRLEKAMDLTSLESGRNQANAKVSLTDALFAGSGFAGGETPEERVAFAAILGLLNKGRRSVGPAMAARSMDAVAKQLARVPKYAQLAEQNPAGFSALVQRLSEKVGAGMAQPVRVPAEEQRVSILDAKQAKADEPAPLRGEAKWMQNGIKKLGLENDPELLQSKEIRRLLIEASDLPEGSRALNRIKEQINRSRKGKRK
jgi:hypothetical protein